MKVDLNLLVSSAARDVSATFEWDLEIDAERPDMGLGLPTLIAIAALTEPMLRWLFYIATATSVLTLGKWLSERRSHFRDVRALEDSRQRVDLAVEAADLGLWEWSSADDSIWLSQRGRDLMGIGETGKIRRERFLEYIHAEDRPDFEHRFQMLSRENPRFEMETRVMLAQTREVRWVASRGRAHFDAAGEMDQLFGASVDCSARRQAQAIAEQQRNQLTHLTRIATLGQLTGSLAHEITQPLTAILSNSQAALHHLASSPTNVDELRNIVRDIVADDRRASDIVYRLRAMVRKATPRFAEVAPREVIKETAGLMHSELLQRNVTLTLCLGEELPTVQADRVQLQQVMLNLLLNATDAVAENPIPERVIEIHAQQVDNAMLSIAFADRGPGFLPEQLLKLFEPFHSTKPHGLGIGLWISRVIMENHGGQIQLANRPDRGAIVTLLLPISNDRKTMAAHG